MLLYLCFSSIALVANSKINNFQHPKTTVDLLHTNIHYTIKQFCFCVRHSYKLGKVELKEKKYIKIERNGDKKKQKKNKKTGTFLAPVICIRNKNLKLPVQPVADVGEGKGGTCPLFRSLQDSQKRPKRRLRYLDVKFQKFSGGWPHTPFPGH